MAMTNSNRKAPVTKIGAILPVTANAYPTTFLAPALTYGINISLNGYQISLYNEY